MTTMLMMVMEMMAATTMTTMTMLMALTTAPTTIVITTSGSPLAAAGTIHLAADHPEGYDRYSPMVSRLMHLMIIDILATCVALRIGSGKLQPLLREMKNNLRNKRYA